MINVRCTTPIDKYRSIHWPTQLPARPMIGDWIQATDYNLMLKVTRVAFAAHGVMEVELHTWDGSVPT